MNQPDQSSVTKQGSRKLKAVAVTTAALIAVGAWGFASVKTCASLLGTGTNSTVCSDHPWSGTAELRRHSAEGESCGNQHQR